MKIRDPLLQFPCSFPIKVMGLNNEAFTSAVDALIRKHLQPSEFSYSARPSSGSTYLSITLTITAQSREQLDAIYRDLNAEQLVLMTL
jgi:putative lipoic acid-binding regulatory protein